MENFFFLSLSVSFEYWNLFFVAFSVSDDYCVYEYTYICYHYIYVYNMYSMDFISDVWNILYMIGVFRVNKGEGEKKEIER